ncbi:MAG: energy-coupled thiamine transporter ThiT [Eubacteriales bacterium]
MSTTKTTKPTNIRLITEGAIMIALALILSYIQIGFLQYGGSIDFVMIPLIFYAIRWGLLPGVIAGVAFGTLNFIFANGFALNWVSLLLDYSVAYGAVGLAGLFRGKKWGGIYGSLVGGTARFIVHYISGITVYAMYAPEGQSPMLYSFLYNISYMLPNIIIAVVVFLLLEKPMGKYLTGKDLKLS